MKFTKMHGTGNDFVVVDARGLPEREWRALAARMCDRHFGAGADGLILLLPSEKADLRMRMWNPDGSEAEMCGNGIRCFTKLALEGATGIGNRQLLTAETGAGILNLRPIWRGPHVAAVQVDMGAPVFEPERVPVRVPEPSAIEPDSRGIRWVREQEIEAAGRVLAVSCVSMGNPHAVHFTDEPLDAYPLETIGPAVEHHPWFPNRVNFHIARVEDRSHIRMRTWERGAGLTLACGTGACAVAVAAHQLGWTDACVEVAVPGGTLTIEWPGTGPVLMTGPAETVFTGEWLDKE